MTSSSLIPPSLVQQKNLPLPLVRTHARIPATIILLQMCHNFQEVRQLHAQLVVSGLLDRTPIAGRLIESYVSMSQICYAASIFNTRPSPDVFAYNTMIRGLSSFGECPYESLLLYNELLLGGLTPDNYTYTFVFKACTRLKALSQGKQVHGRIIKAGIAPDTHIHSSLIHMYSNSDSMDCAEHVLAEFSEENVVAKNAMISGYLSQGQVENARAMFNEMTAKDAASWSAMISGYTKNGLYAEALAMFQEMTISGQTQPNESTLVSSLSACAHLGTLDQGRWIHAYINNTYLWAKSSVNLGTALVDMYAKCGDIECGYQVFRKMPQKDVVTWGVIISGFAIHGRADRCFQLFDEMVGDGIHPNAVIFVAILSACSHAGYVELGYRYFNHMVHDFGIRPSIEHYGCMVDLLGRAGMLAEAEEIIVSMAEDPSPVIWGAFLSACRNHNDLMRGRRAFRHLLELESMSGDRYKLARQMFATAGEKEDAAKIIKLIKEKELETTSGSSFIEVDGIVHEFFVGNIHHSNASEIHGL